MGKNRSVLGLVVTLPPLAVAPPALLGAGAGRACPMDYTQDGLTFFLVPGGQLPSSGPIQLLAPQPSGGLTRTFSSSAWRGTVDRGATP